MGNWEIFHGTCKVYPWQWWETGNIEIFVFYEKVSCKSKSFQYFFSKLGQ